MSSRDALLRTIHHMGERGTLYLWTFTFQYLHDARRSRELWAMCSKSLVQNAGFSGVRVFELHERRGIHIHVLANRRFDVRLVRRLSRLCGFGRIHVCRCWRPEYIAKYVTKQHRADNPWLKGVRLWAYCGTDRTPHNRCKDLKYRSLKSSVVRSLIECGYGPYQSMLLSFEIVQSLRGGDLDFARAGTWAYYYATVLSSEANVSGVVVERQPPKRGGDRRLAA